MKKSKLIVFYDGNCPICIKITRNWKRLDCFSLLHFISFRNPSNIKGEKILLEEFEKEMYSRQVDKYDYSSGLDSFIRIILRIPILWALLIPLYLSKMLGIGDKFYSWFASKRKIIPQNSCEEQCSIK